MFLNSQNTGTEEGSSSTPSDSSLARRFFAHRVATFGKHVAEDGAYNTLKSSFSRETVKKIEDTCTALHGNNTFVACKAMALVLSAVPEVSILGSIFSMVTGLVETVHKNSPHGKLAETHSRMDDQSEAMKTVRTAVDGLVTANSMVSKSKFVVGQLLSIVSSNWEKFPEPVRNQMMAILSDLGPTVSTLTDVSKAFGVIANVLDCVIPKDGCTLECQQLEFDDPNVPAEDSGDELPGFEDFKNLESLPRW